MMCGARRSLVLSLICIGITACGGGPAAPQQPTAIPIDRAAIIDALEYWRTAAGISYTLIDVSEHPRLLIRSGTDGLAPQGGGRALVDGTFPDNQARSGLVVFEPGGGQYCRGNAALCRYLYRHEIGHAFGFLDHSNAGLMLSGPDALTDRERAMIIGLYSLPHGARVASDGTWTAPGSLSGQLADTQAAQDVIAWNANAPTGSVFRQQGTITRWELPVRVYIQP